MSGKPLRIGELQHEVSETGKETLVKRELDLARVRVMPIRNEEDEKGLIKTFQRIRPDSEEGFPVATTHMIVVDNQIAGGFCLESPTVYWWMLPEKNTMRNSMSAWGCLETLMAQSGRDTYLIVCEDTSEYHKVLDKRLPKVIGNGNSANHHIFVRKIPNGF
jgi:hypothetical protein